MSISRLNQLLAFHESQPQDAFVLFALAKEYEKMENNDKALHHYLLLRTHHPEYVGLYYHLGKLYERLGNPSEAYDTYKAGMDVARQVGDQHALGELAEARLMLGED